MVKPVSRTSKTHTELLTPEYFCFDHVIIFKNADTYNRHSQLCKKQIKTYVCTLLTMNGEMCGKSFSCGNFFADHTRKVHRTFMCVDCEYVTKSRERLRTHQHIGGARTGKFLGQK